ncbi:hypothetical protein FRC03_000750 [Tulasnella sp. 419]|nr:hypothetical protein FRC03_000750 [Tulasnella sp. 419]
MNSERAVALQTKIRKELAAKGYSTEADTVMAEYITIMLINSKTSDQITEELKDLIGEEYDPAFTEWLFQEKIGSISHPDPSSIEPSSTNETPSAHSNQTPTQASTSNSSKPEIATRSRAFPQGQSRPLLNQALSSLPSGTFHTSTTTNSAQKRTASRRSLSPSGPAHKKRHSELPDRPRAMRDEPTSGPATNTRRSLLDRVGAKSTNIPSPDHVQEHINAITQQHQLPLAQVPSLGTFPVNGVNPHTAAFPMMHAPGFGLPGAGFVASPGSGGSMDATMMAISQIGQIALQLGLVPGVNGPPSSTVNQPGTSDLVDRKGSGRGQPSSRGSAQYVAPHLQQHLKPAQINGIAPVSQSSPSTKAPSTNQTTSNAAPPSRPLSPTLCKFATACTNAFCRYSHPSPVATVESGVVLSTEPCSKGLECEDKDCLNAHPSKAAKDVGPGTSTLPHSQAPANAVHTNCRFGIHCTRPDCAFLHPPQRTISGLVADTSATPCRFGAACTKVTCPFKHPEGRVLPTQFSKGLNGAPPTNINSSVIKDSDSRNRSVDFRKRNPPDDDQKKSSLALNATAAPFIPSPSSSQQTSTTENLTPISEAEKKSAAVPIDA